MRDGAVPAGRGTRRSNDPDAERQGVRTLCLLIALIALVVGVVGLSLGAYLLALGCLVAMAATGALAVSLYGQLHQEALARDARARAGRPITDPFPED